MPSTPLPAVANVFKVVLSGTIGAHNWAVILHAGWSGSTPSVAICNAFGADLEAGWVVSGGWQGQLPASTVLTQIELTDLTSTIGANGGWNGVEAGSNGGAEIGANTAVLVNYPSAFRYRGGHPRSYFPPGVQGSLTSTSQWSTGAVTAYETAFGHLQSVLNSATSGGCNLTGQCAVSYVNRASNPTPPYYRATPIVMPISSGAYSVPQEVASQRRRAGRK